MGSALDTLYERFMSLSIAHRECQDIVREEDVDMDSKLRHMKGIASAHNLSALPKELQCVMFLSVGVGQG